MVVMSKRPWIICFRNMERLPKKVLDAIFGNDRKALSAMGKKGAERAADSQAFKKSEEQAKLVEAALEQANIYSARDGEVLPPDQAAIDALKDQIGDN